MIIILTEYKFQILDNCTWKIVEKQGLQKYDELNENKCQDLHR